MTAEAETSVRPVHAAISLRRLYCSNISFEQAFVPTDESPPRPGVDIDLEVEMQFREVAEDRLDVRLTMRCKPDTEQDQPYLVEVAYVGEFMLGQDVGAMNRQMLARTNCSAILLPYVRQTISDITSRGTNGPIQVPPLNVAEMLKHVGETEGSGEGAQRRAEPEE